MRAPPGIGGRPHTTRRKADFPVARGGEPAAMACPRLPKIRMAKQVEKAAKTGGLAKALKLFVLILLVLLVPVTMDQFEVDREQVRLVGRIAGGSTLLMLAYGLFKKMLKLLAFVVFALITVVVLIAEGEIEAPRVQDWFADLKADGR
jgi:hypothetical protein